MMRRQIVISGINIRSAGPLTIIKQCLDEMSRSRLIDEYRFVILVSDRNLFKEYTNTFEVIDFPRERTSRLARYYYEYHWMRRYSRRNDVAIWLSLNDKTPRVISDHQFTYCHNAAMFYRCSLFDCCMSPTMALYTFLYRFVYRLNIRSNDAIIVQQHWIADEFRERFPIRDVVVMRPEQSYSKSDISTSQQRDPQNGQIVFLYPAAPKSYKNVECLLEASRLLQNQGVAEYSIWLTISGEENRYARYLRKRAETDSHIKFLGFLSQQELRRAYEISDCLVFLSKLETWGLPLSEYREYGKSIIVSDLPYSHETLLGYSDVAFVPPEDYKGVACLMKQIVDGESFKHSEVNESRQTNRTFCSWTSFFESIAKSE